MMDGKLAACMPLPPPPPPGPRNVHAFSQYTIIIGTSKIVEADPRTTTVNRMTVQSTVLYA